MSSCLFKPVYFILEFRGEVIGGKCPKSMYKAIMPLSLEAIAEMYEEDEKKHDK